MSWRTAAIGLPLLVANYFFAVLRHEGAHALVAKSAGSIIIDFHVWPPRGSNLSWITQLDHPARSSSSIALQAALPYLLSFAILAACLFYLASARRRDFIWLNVVLTGVLFPLADLVFGVGAYWIADNDFYYIFGSGSLPARLILSFWVAILAGLTAWVLRRATPREVGAGARA